MGTNETKGVPAGRVVKRHYVRWALLAITGMVLPVPVVWWAAMPSSSLRIQIVDKTVPHPTYREHGALMWALNHHKAIPPGHERPWDLPRDYVGYTPPSEGELPSTGFGTRLTDEHLSAIDLLFVADAYGVYKGDYEKFDDVFTHLDYSTPSRD